MLTLVTLGVIVLAVALTSLLARARLRLLVAIGVCSLAALVSAGLLTGWEQLLTPYQRERITAYVNPNSDPLGSQWQINQAQIALAAGQVFGKGLLQGTQVNYDLLPYAYTDFIFVAIGEQLGLVGTLGVLLLLYTLVVRVWLVARQQPTGFGALCCYGVAVLLTVNTVVNVGMNTGILPVTGVPLPFISYGGTAVIVNLCAVGLVQCLHADNKQSQVRKITAARG
jgi:rod shape determining protein RodA